MKKVAFILLALTMISFAPQGALANDDLVLQTCGKIYVNSDRLDCMVKERDALLEQLEKIEKRIIESDREQEIESKEIGTVAYTGQAETFEKSTQSFRQYMADACSHVWGTYGTGSLGGHGHVACEIRLIKERTAFLK